MSKAALLALSIAVAGNANAQLSSNPDKFLGNITTSGNVDFGNEKFYTLWNQITCENETKWASVEGNNNSFNWSGGDRAYNYAKTHNFPFKFHALVWGSQYPSWIEQMTPEQRYKEIVQWMDEAKKHYPDLQLIDVVNEAVDGHQAGTKYFIEALGGRGVTGYDWIIKAFELAYERWPNAILIYNDFNTFQWNVDQYLDIVKTLRNAGAPIDAYGCQSHDLTDCSLTTFKNSMTKLQNALKMPMYSTEYDIGTADDAKQLQRYKEQIPYMWEQDYVAGVTLWGYIYGRTWVPDGNSGIIKNGADRPAMKWLREYMQTDAAKKAKSPFPGMKKEASVYIKPSALNVEKNKECTINVRAAMRTKTIEKVDLYAKNILIGTLTEAPYVTTYTPTATGSAELKAVVTTTDGNTYTRYAMINVSNPRTAYKNTPTELPGVLEAENFDVGADGIAFHDNNSSKQGTGASYRSDAGGIDVEKGGTGYTVGYTEVGEWMEYTVDVKEAGIYSYDISYSAPDTDPSINMSLNKAGIQIPLTPDLNLPNTGDWSKFKTVHGRLLMPLEAGQQIMRVSIVGGNATYLLNIDKITFKKVDVNEGIDISLDDAPRTVMETVPNPITPDIESETPIKSVAYYVDGVLTTTVTEAPFTFNYIPEAKGIYNIMAIATDENGKQSNMVSYEVEAVGYRAPFMAVELPGTIEVENFDKGGEGVAFHDSDNVDEGKTKYRTDNEGLDIVTGNGGHAVGYTKDGEWMEYTVNVKETDKFVCECVYSIGTTAGMFSIQRRNESSMENLWTMILSKGDASSMNTYKTLISTTQRELKAGQHVIRINVSRGGFNLDKIIFKSVGTNGIEETISLSDCTYVVTDISGARVATITANSSIELQNKIKALTGRTGIFVVKNTINGNAVKMLVK